MDAERVEFEDALTWLGRAVPAAESVQELDTLTSQLKICALNAATAFHREYHHRLADAACAGSPIEPTLRMWAADGRDPRRIFDDWRREFLSAFDATHPSPPPERAAAILRIHFRNPPPLDCLAAQAGSSRSALTRTFRQRYGLSCGEYVTRLRLAWFAEAVRESTCTTGDLAEEAGYSSYHNLCEALKRTTGFTPSQIRGLADVEFLELRRVKLAVPGGTPAAVETLPRASH